MPVFAQPQAPSVEFLKCPQLVENPPPPPSPLHSAHILAFPAWRGLAVPRISTISLGDSQHAICVTHTGMACRGDKAALSESRESCDHCSCWRTFATSVQQQQHLVQLLSLYLSVLAVKYVAMHTAAACTPAPLLGFSVYRTLTFLFCYLGFCTLTC